MEKEETMTTMIKQEDSTLNLATSAIKIPKYCWFHPKFDILLTCDAQYHESIEWRQNEEYAHLRQQQ